MPYFVRRVSPNAWLQPGHCDAVRALHAARLRTGSEVEVLKTVGLPGVWFLAARG